MTPMALAGELPRAARLAVLALGATLALGVMALLAHVVMGAGSGVVFDDILELAAAVAAALLCAGRAAWIAQNRGAWTTLALALAVYALGSALWSFWIEEMSSPPFPSAADACWLLFYPAAYGAMLALIRPEVGRIPLAVVLDGVLAGLAGAALGVAFVYGPVASNLSEESAAAVATNLAYPLGDVLLCGFVVGAFALQHWRPSRMWILLGAAYACFAAADVSYVQQAAGGSFDMEGLPNLMWSAGHCLVGLAAWQPLARRVADLEYRPALVAPGLCSLAAVGVLLYGHFASLSSSAVLLAAATLGIGVLRTGLAFREVRQLAESRREALTDDLTGLSNRRHFFLRLEAALDTGEGRLAVLVLDLDDFKELNDTLGHPAGDLLLEEVAARLARCVRAQDVLARLGGDEFAMLLSDAGPAEARAAAARIAATVGRPYEIEGIRLALQASVGIALYPDSAATAQGLVARADVAMYHAKASRTGAEVYVAGRDSRSRERLALSGELRRAIEAGELVLHYQPICDPRTGSAVAVEALVRWQHPERGLLMPSDFLDLAERAGTMRDLTLWVVRAATAQARAWHDEHLPVRVSVNLAPQNLLDLRFPGDVRRMLEEARLPPGALTLEITEDTVMADPLRAMDVLGALGELGVGLALDDFGTGWSSLAHLRRMPVDELKIDRSFVSGMTDDHDDAVIVRSTIDLARALRLRVVAEGVEDPGAWSALNELGCDLIQGFGISRPLPTAEATEWLSLHDHAILPLHGDSARASR